MSYIQDDQDELTSYISYMMTMDNIYRTYWVKLCKTNKYMSRFKLYTDEYTDITGHQMACGIIVHYPGVDGGISNYHSMIYYDQDQYATVSFGLSMRTSLQMNEIDDIKTVVCVDIESICNRIEQYRLQIELQNEHCRLML